MVEFALELPPLPSGLRGAVSRVLRGPGALAPSANPGLVFERFPRCWETSKRGWDLGLGRKDFLASFAAGFERLEHSCRPLVDARLEVLSQAFGPGRDYESCWRFVTGLGADHPLENGFSFHRLLGVPFLAGASIKGLVRVAARLEGLDGDEEARLFGSAGGENGNEERGQGFLVFLDALPVTWPRLGVDVVNNHHPTWTAMLDMEAGAGGTLEAARAASAAGLEDPVPVFFLSVKPGVQMRFWLVERRAGTLKAEEIERVWRWLDLGLKHLGIGAKTAVGYGRFAPVSAKVPPSVGNRPKISLNLAAGRPSWEKRAQAIGWGEAQAQVPRLLAELSGDDRRQAALKIVKNLGRKRLLQRQDPWAGELLQAAAID